MILRKYKPHEIRFYGQRLPDHSARVWYADMFEWEWTSRKLSLCLGDGINHSPTGFEWGYYGSGPAQLAYAILRYYTGSMKFAREHYMEFKRDIIAKIPMDETYWELSGQEIQDWIDSIEEK